VELSRWCESKFEKGKDSERKRASAQLRRTERWREKKERRGVDNGTVKVPDKK